MFDMNMIVPQDLQVDLSAYMPQIEESIRAWQASQAGRDGGSQYAPEASVSPAAAEFAVQPSPATAAAPAPGNADFAVPVPPASAAPPAPPSDFAVAAPPTALSAPAPVAAPPGVPDFGMYAGSASDYQLPELQAPTDKFSTPYYAAYTNDGDLAGAVMVADGQKIRLVDNKTGEVVFEGLGPQAAQQAVGIANAVSEDKGRKASWSIQADTGDGSGWLTQAYERYDPKKQGVLGTVLDIAAPFILSALLPGVGTALAGALGSTLGGAAFHGIANLGSGLIQGENFKQAAGGALTAGALSGVTGAVLNRVPGANDFLTRVTNPINDGLNSIVDASGLRVVLDPLNDGLVNVIDGAGNVLSTVRGTVEGVRGELKDLVGLGGGSSGSGVTIPSPNIPPIGGEGFVAPVDVFGNPFSVNLPGVSGVDGLFGGSGGDTLVEGVDVVAQRPPNQPGVPTAPVLDLDGLDPGLLDDPVDPFTDETEVEGVDVSPLPQAPPPIVGLPTPIPPVTPVDLPEVVVSPPPQPPEQPSTPTPPPQTAPPGGGVVLPGVPTPPQTTTGGKYSINSLAGTRGSLSPIYSAQLPSPLFGARTPREVQVDQRYAIQRPEAAFFNRVSQAPGPSEFAVPSPSAQRRSGVGDVNRDGVIDDLDVELFRRRFGGYADGGSVRGPGSGRSDSIDARLSDGEYVIDAETVALLGDGSSRAGADKLDDFRVAIRKHKGRDLARGRFSASARDPHSYLGGR